MKIYRTIITLFLFAFAITVIAQTKVGGIIDNMSFNMMETRRADAFRPLQYRPEGDAFVCINGKNRYTRALYGSHTAFRIETSDRPVFAIFNPFLSANNSKERKHIAFKLKIGEKMIALDSTDYCKAIYKPGRRDYELKDAVFGKGILKIYTQAFYDKEGGIFKFNFEKFPKGAKLICHISEIKYENLMRNGDMGPDPVDAFDPPANPQRLKTFEVDLSSKNQAEVYIVIDNPELIQVDISQGENLYNSAESAREKLANTLKINTPDPYFNTLGGSITMAADGAWDGEVWLHGAIGWRTPLTGWRGAYAGNALGWHDRNYIHFDNYAASQVTDVEVILPHPQQDAELNMARAAKIWGTPMYSNGYIARNPNNPKQMHHYDMNLVYIDALLWHLKWTGDLDYAKKIFPVIKLHLQWEKRNFDPDGDGLYENYAATWASDALMYNSGGTTVGSAYNYRSNRIAAEIAALIGEDPEPYKAEADKILKAINEKLWLNDKGWWAEYVDFMGNKMLHPNAAVWTIYTAIDSEVGDIFKNYQATHYIDEYIPHISIKSNDIKDDYATISTSSWMPYSWSVNNVAHAEVGHTALAYWLAGRPNEAYKLFKGAILDGMYLGNSPGNVGQVSYYDAARGECYRDFADVIGVYSRAIVQGLFGIIPNLLHGKITIRPGFPSDWKFAEIQHPDIDFSFQRKGDKDFYRITNKFNKQPDMTLLINAYKDKIGYIKVNGKPVKWNQKEGIDNKLIEIFCNFARKYDIEIKWNGSNVLHTPMHTPNLLCTPDFSNNILVDINPGTQKEYILVNIDNMLKASVTDIFRNKYLSPRSPYTTMQTPIQGVGEWCHPNLIYDIDDAGFRAAVKNEIFETPFGVPFRVPAGKNNIAFTTLWDNYPDSISAPLSGQAEYAFLMMAGTTNHMQYGVTNGTVTVYYTDDSNSELVLRNPETWCAIEQDYYVDGLQFKLNTPRPYRVAFKTGIVSRDMERDMKIIPTEVYGREIEGGAGIILGIILDKNKELKSIKWKSIANEVIVGMMAVTLVK